MLFSVDGMEDLLEFCKKLIDRCNVGLAPGSAFGPGGEGFCVYVLLLRLIN